MNLKIRQKTFSSTSPQGQNILCRHIKCSGEDLCVFFKKNNSLKNTNRTNYVSAFKLSISTFV